MQQEAAVHTPAAERANRERFVALCARNGVRTHADDVFREVRAHYDEPHRHYHTAAHLGHCLKEFDKAGHLIPDPDAVELGLWFHDAVYHPKACDNELLSAELFMRKIGRYIAPARAEHIHRLIIATVHDTLPECEDERFIVDIDLSSFALPWHKFALDSANIRKEYLHLSDSEFYRKQFCFLKALDRREHFYSTGFFRQRYERIARENLARRLSNLSARGYG